MAIVKTTTKNPKTLHGILEYVADLNKTRPRIYFRVRNLY